MARHFPAAHAFVGNVEENHRSTQRITAPDKLRVDHMADADHDENQYLAENSLKAHIAGKGLVDDGAHHPSKVVDHHKGDKRIKETVHLSEEPAQPGRR